MRVSIEADSSIYRKVSQPKNLKSERGSQIDPIRTNEVRSEGVAQMREVDQNVGLIVFCLENWSTHTINAGLFAIVFAESK
jgi:hypothetical protein